MLEALGFALVALVVVVGWKVQSVQTDLRILRAEIAKGSRLTADEEESAATGQPPLRKA